MPFPPVEKSLGKSYPSTEEELVGFIQRVMGPTLDELRTRYNQLPYLIGIQIEDTAAELAAIDTTNMKDGILGIASADRELYCLNKAGTPGAGDLTAIPAGSWDFELAL